MTSPTTTLETTHEKTNLQLSQVAPLALGHMTNDIFPASVAPLLPVLIEKLSLSLTQAGFLYSFLMAPGLLNPFIGYLADKLRIRYFVILAPAVTATLLGLMGYAPNFLTLALLLFGAGVSTACFHAPAPPMVTRVSGRQLGLGMSIFMSAGEFAYGVGPLLAVWVVTNWTLHGMARLIVFGWAVSFLLWLRLRNVAADIEKPGRVREILPALRGLFIPMAIFSLLRAPLLESFIVYLPTLLSNRGVNLMIAGASLSILRLFGAAGALLVGSISDRIGRRPVLIMMTLLPAALAPLFLSLEGWKAMAVIAALGFFGLATNPILMAITQERFPNNRAMANGLFMMISFVVEPIGAVIVGFLGDRMGLEKAMLYTVFVSVFALLPILKLRDKPAAAAISK